MQRIADRFGTLGILFYIDNVCGVETFDTLGLTFEMGETVRIRDKAERTWRFWGLHGHFFVDVEFPETS